MTIENILKHKPCKRVDLNRVRQEIERVRTLAQDLSAPERQSYHLHQVPVTGEVFLAGDAKVLNRYTNKSGRGDLRYLFDRDTNEYRGLAQEQDGGRYRRVA